MNAKAQDELDIDIVLDVEALPQEVAAVEEVVRQEGIPGSVRAAYFRASADNLPWIIFFLVPPLVFFSAFLKGAGQEAGRDAYKMLRGFISRLYAARRHRNGSVVIRDSDTVLISCCRAICQRKPTDS